MSTVAFTPDEHNHDEHDEHNHLDSGEKPM
jgi:hypothetical protein